MTILLLRRPITAMTIPTTTLPRPTRLWFRNCSSLPLLPRKESKYPLLRYKHYHHHHPSSVSVCFFGTSRQHRASSSSKEPKRQQDKTATSPPTTTTTALILPKTNFLLPSEASSSAFLSSHHALDLYDPYTHGASGGAGGGALNHNASSQYEPASPLYTHVLWPLLSVLGRPLSTADYMRLCLTHPEYGYYTQGTTDSNENNDGWEEEKEDWEKGEDSIHETDPSNSTSHMNKDIIIGADFVTAPEVSQVFGECLGVWFAMRHTQHYAHKEWQWVECGPGKGSLMADLITFQSMVMVDEFGSYCRRIHFVETSPVLRRMQKEALERLTVRNLSWEFHQDPSTTSTTTTTAAPTSSTPPDASSNKVVSVYWHDSFADFLVWQQAHTPMVTYCIGQEFVDALPVYSFEKTREGYWRERMVSLPRIQGDDDEDEDDDENKDHVHQPSERNKPCLVIVLAPEVTPPLRTLLNVDENGFLLDEETDKNVPTGSIIEVNPEGILLVQDMAKLLERAGGAVLLIDYGQEGSADTIRAFSKHQQVGFLSRPGQVDITADVDFAALRHAVNHRENNDGNLNECNATPPTHSVCAFGPVTQGNFLMSMGMQERVLNAIEDEQTSDEHAENLYQAMVRLASPEEMGERYKVLCIVAQSQSERDTDESPPGF